MQIYDSANPAGVWDTSTQNWDGSTLAWSNGNDALFDSGTGRVTVTENITLGQLVISTTATSTIGGRTNTYVFSGSGALEFGAVEGVLDTTASGLTSAQIDNNLIAIGEMVVKATGAGTGAGWLLLAGDNSGLAGGIRIDSGLLAVATPSATGSGAITLNGGGIFTNANRSGPSTSEIVGPTNLHLANNIVVNDVAGNLIRTWGGRSVFFTGTVSGAGGFNKSDGGAAYINSSGLVSPLTLSGGSLWLGNINNGGQITISGNNLLGYFGSGETTNRVVNFSTGSGGQISAHGNLNFTSNMTGAAAAMGITITGGGVASMNGITNTTALINFNKQGAGTWTVNGDITPNGGNVRPQGGILDFSATASTTGDAIITAGNRSNGGIIRFSAGSGVKTASANTNGILGGWATFDNSTWAKTNGTGLAIDGFTTFTNDIWAAGNNTNVTLSGGDPAADSTTNSLRFNEAGAKTLTLSGTNTLESGGLLVTGNVGANDTTITGGTLRGANTSDLIVHQFNTGGTLTISSIISNNTGATGLTKTGAGTVILGGANNYTGTTRVFEGTLRVNANSGGKIYDVASGATLQLGYSTGNSVYGYGVTVNGAGTSATTGVYLNGGSVYTLQGSLRLTGLPTTIRQFGTGNATLAGWDINGTHLVVEPTASGSVIASGIQFAPGGFGYRMNVAPGASTSTGDVIFEGPLTGSGARYQKEGFGSVRITGEGTNSNPFEVRQGAVILGGGDNRLGAGSSARLGFNADSGLLVLEGVNQTLTSLTNQGTGTGNRVVGGSATLSTLTINNSADSTLAAHLGGSGANQNNLALAKSGLGALTLSGSNTYSGETTVNAGSLRLDYSLNDNSKLSDTATLTLGGSLILDGGTHVEVVGGTVVTGAVSINRTTGTGSIQLGALSRTGAATLNIAAPNIAKTTTPNDVNGRLPTWITVDGSPAANDGSGNIVVFVPTFTDVTRLGGLIPNNPAANVRIINGGTSGPVVPEFAGTTDILSLTQNATDGPATVSLVTGDILRLGELGVITADPGAEPLTIGGGLLTAGGADNTPGTLAVTGSAVVTIASDLNDNGIEPVALLKSGPGSLTLTGFNSHTGGVTLSGGQLLLGGDAVLGLSGAFTINGGAIDNSTGSALDIFDTIPQVWNGDFTFLGTNDLAFTNGGVTITGNHDVTVTASTLRIGTAVSGSSGFTKLGAGTLLLDGGGNNWTGTTTVSDGVLEVATRTNDGPFVIAPAGTLRLGYSTGGGYASTNLKLNGAGVSATTGLYLEGGNSYNASGQIELLTAPTTIRHYGTGLAAIGMFDINGNGINVSAAASGSVIDANIQMISSGFGMSMTAAAGSETTTGDLVVNGPLNVGNLGFYKRGTGSVRLNGTATTGNAALRVHGGTAIAGASGVIGANAALEILAGASLRLNGFDQTARNLTGAGSVVNGSATPVTLAIESTADTTFSGVLGGPGADENTFGLAKAGSFTLTLSGANTYSGDTSISAGTLSLGQAYLADTAAVRLTTGAGATLNLTHGQPDTVAELWIDGVQQLAGTYNSGNTSFITGSGSLVVTSGPVGDAFTTWAAGKGLDGSPGKEAGFHDDPDGDGFANGLEWILGGEPLDGKSGSLIATSASATGGLTLEFTRNEDSIGLASLFVEYNGTLANPWNSATIGATSSGPDGNGVTVTIDTVPNPDDVTINIPASNAVDGKLFGRMKATKP